MMKTTRTLTAIAALLGGIGLAGTSLAANTATVDKEARMKAWTLDKDALEKALGTGHDKAYYRQTLEKAGYGITAVNKACSAYTSANIACDQNVSPNANASAATNAGTRAKISPAAFSACKKRAVSKRAARYKNATAPAPLNADNTLTRYAASPNGRNVASFNRME